MTKLGTTIRTRLHEIGKTQVWLAEALGVSNNAVSKWIATGKISRENSVAAAKVLEVSVETLLGEPAHRDESQNEPSGEQMLKLAAEMIETYRLAGAADRQRIDLAFREARRNMSVDDQAKPRTG